MNKLGEEYNVNIDFSIYALDKGESEKETKYLQDRIKHEIMPDLEDYEIPSCYDFEIEVYKCTDKEKHFWNYSSLVIKKDGEEYIRINRNYRATPENFTFVHKDDEDFVITSGDYQTFCIINLNTKEVNTYSSGSIGLGAGWCPTEINYCDWDDSLRIDGCCWGGDFGTLIISLIGDLNNPCFDDCETEYEDDE